MNRSTVVLLLLLLTSCTTAQLDLPPDSYGVEGANPRIWNRPIAFGPWRTAMVDEGTRRSWLADLGVIQIGKADQGYHFRVGDLTAECHTRELVIGRNDVFVDPALGRAPLLACGFDAGGARSTLLLSRTGRVEPSLRGELRGADGTAREVRSLHRPVGAAFASGEPFGYEIVENGKRVAAVETINRGRVWIDPSSRDADTLAATAASLLLFRDPDAGTVD